MFTILFIIQPQIFLCFLIGVCIKPALVKAYQPNIDEAMLVWIFNASNFDHLVTFNCEKDDEPIYSGGQYHIYHYFSNTTENKVHLILKISSATNSDIGNYTAQLIYNETLINNSNSKSEIASVYMSMLCIQMFDISLEQ